MAAFLAVISLAIFAGSFTVGIKHGDGFAPVGLLALQVAHATSLGERVAAIGGLAATCLLLAIAGFARCATFATGSTMVLAEHAAEQLSLSIITGKTPKELPDGS